MTGSDASRSRQAAIGLGVASAIAAAWAALHIGSVFFLPLDGAALAAAPLLVLSICWLNVGLFIVAHDAMHGSLAPGLPKVNLWTGRLALAVYAGFSFDRLRAKHFEHHRNPGTSADPDFSADHPTAFWPWYLAFFRQYFGWRELVVLTALVGLYTLVGAPYPNLLLFWALPTILSSLQLFYFGTFLPHRSGAEPFGDRHRARNSDYGRLVSLLTCFHFGYHHEHHRSPATPWWRLPAERLSSAPPR